MTSMTLSRCFTVSLFLLSLLTFPLLAQPTHFVVSNVNDDGSGSLRQAIRDVNAACQLVSMPCEIVFQIPAPVPESGWFTIQPFSALPEIVASVNIDGASQKLFTGDTNPDGPEIEINGAFVKDQSGLRLRPTCAVDVRNLAVNGFAIYGIEVNRQSLGNTDPCIVSGYLRLAVNISENYLGTDPRGRVARPNLRGLGIFTVYSEVTDNLISGNRRSGIYVTDSFITEIFRNTIGIGKDGAPLGNGAGIFLHDTSIADITANVIAHNDGMAIARPANGLITIRGNSMYDNLQQGIDIGTDGTTPNRAEDLGFPNRPVLYSATYDPILNATIVRGRLDSMASGTLPSFDIDIFASARLSVWAYPQAELVVQHLRVENGHSNFEVTVPGDLRGQWITASNTSTHFHGLARKPGDVATESHESGRAGSTSELSDAVMAR
jgi:parallel beta-helix repeat protein